jgi:hypothetical protein
VTDRQDLAPDATARVALWRALHVEIDPPPHVLKDESGLMLQAPDQAPPRGHGPKIHATLPRFHRGPCALHRGSNRGKAGRGWVNMSSRRWRLLGDGGCSLRQGAVDGIVYRERLR